MGIPDQYLSALTDCTVVYLKLDVNNLHRFYAPVSGTVVARCDHLEPLRMSHSVRPFTLQAGWNILTENRRVILMIDNPQVGVVAMMVVGGIAIDGIDIAVREGQRVEQGDEIGCFHSKCVVFCVVSCGVVVRRTVLLLVLLVVCSVENVVTGLLTVFECCCLFLDLT